MRSDEKRNDDPDVSVELPINLDFLWRLVFHRRADGNGRPLLNAASFVAFVPLDDTMERQGIRKRARARELIILICLSIPTKFGQR